MTPVLVSAEWLLDNIDRVRVLDASSHLPTVKRDAEAEFLAAHIPGAQRFDIDAIADKGHAMPHMVPSPTSSPNASPAASAMMTMSCSMTIRT